MRWIVAAVLAYYAVSNFGAAWEDWHWQVGDASFYLACGIITGACTLAVLFGWGM